MSSTKKLIAILICAFFLNAAYATAQELTPELLIRKLLDSYWQSGSDNQRASQALYDDAKNPFRDNPKVMLAYAVNRMQHAKQRDALSLVRQLPKARHMDIEAD